MIGNHSAKRMHTADLVVSTNDCPDWVSCKDKMPKVGDVVRCTAGLATVTKICGKTGDGSRLLQLKPAEGDQQQFFAAASNVLIAP